MKLPLVFLMLLFSINLIGQESKSFDEKTENHEHHKNEIGIANAPVYFLKEAIFSYGLHVHYVHKIPKSAFGIGLGYERIFDAHKHQTIGLVTAYQPMERLSLIVSPGLTFEANNPKANFALHLETSYEFEIKNFHIGPAFEFAYDPEDFHLSLGLHVGYGF